MLIGVIDRQYTDREIRAGHNLEKMLLTNEFGYAVEQPIGGK